MSFIGVTEKGRGFAPGWFLESEVGVVRKTRQMAQTGASASEDGGKYVPMGTVWPANDATAEGIVYEDIDVTAGDAPGSVVLAGRVYEDRLPVQIAEAAKTALSGKGFVFIATSPAVTRPY